MNTPTPRNGRVTIRDIAREAGLHFTTVARALRESDLVKRARLARVKEAVVALDQVARVVCLTPCRTEEFTKDDHDPRGLESGKELRSELAPSK